MRLVAVLFLTLLALPGTARAEIGFTPCGPLQCGRVAVPLDRSGAVPGTLSIAVYRAPARTQPARGVLLGLPGGPGDSARAYFLRRLRGFDDVRATHDLVVVDPRGTGGSGALRCGDAASCADSLGPAAAHYTSRAVADDLDAVRAGLGLDKLMLYGISYGTWFAQTYARRHPDRTAGLVLDGPVSLSSQDDVFRTKLFAAMPRALRSVCARRACRAITADPYRDVAALLRGRPLGGRRPDARGIVQAESLDVRRIALALTNLDVNPPLRAELPAAVAAARAGDPLPLMRAVEAAELQPPEDPVRTSPGLNATMQCEELGMPWERTAELDGRGTAADRAMALLPESAFAPVGSAIASLVSNAAPCVGYRAQPEDPLERGPLPAVPTLVLAGDADMRTPLADAVEVARGIAGARLVLFRNTGHGALVEEPTGCASRAVAAFLSGRALGVCRRAELLPRPAFPRALAGVRASGLRRKVVTAAVLTATDALNQAAMRIDSLRGRVGSVSFGGLRAGRAYGDEERVTLLGSEYVRGVAVSGIARANGRHELVVPGGELRVRGRTATGTLNGRQVRMKLSPRAVGAAGVRVAEIL